MRNKEDTIAAVATAPGYGAVSIIRIAGPQSWEIAKKICHVEPIDRKAVFCDFNDASNLVIDQGLLLAFKGPNSFTGDDVIELQGHGGSIAPKVLLDETLRLGARIADPGEFTLRAYLNSKIDLAQAEAVADLVASESEHAARASIRSLKGDFSLIANHISRELLNLRVLIEAWLDFPDEDIPYEDQKKIQEGFDLIENKLSNIIKVAWAGEKIKQNKKIALVGAPNVGKSSLMNWLTKKDVSIVSEIPGTTRDAVEKDVVIDGMIITAVDTAGIRETSNVIENEGIARAQDAIEQSDLVVWVRDAQEEKDETLIQTKAHQKVITVFNKSDLINQTNHRSSHNAQAYLVSAKTKLGLEELRAEIVRTLSLSNSETTVGARARHAKSAEKTKDLLLKAKLLFLEQQTLELVAEELRAAHQYFGEITGEVSSDDLLGEIFSSFCIGK